MLTKHINRALNKIDRLSSDETKRLLYRLIEQNNLLQILINNSNYSIIVSNTNHQILYANKHGEKILQKNYQNSNLPLWELMIYEQIPFYLKGLLISDNYNDSHDFKIKSHIINLNLEPLAIKGRISGSIINIQDVTATRQEQAHIQRQSSLANMSNMAAAVAHEIKNPLGAISIHLQLIKRALIEISLPKEVLGDITILEEELERLNEVASNFLYTSRPLELMLVQTDIRTIIIRTIDFMRTELTQYNIGINFIASDKACIVLIDEARIKQVLINLIQNSLSAIQHDGTITIRLQHHSRQMTLSVCDTGEGIPDHMRHQIFEPYFTTKQGGSGLGLTLVYKIIKNHGGEIRLCSPPPCKEKGTEFTVILPLNASGERLIVYDGDH